MTGLPHLPEQPVKTLLIGERYLPLLRQPLLKLGITPVTVRSCPALDAPVQHHADLLAQPVGEKRWIASPESFAELSEKLLPYGQTVLCGASALGREYPEDIPYNGLRIGNHFFHRLDRTDPAVLRELAAQNVVCHDVKQGYGKCSVAVVSETAAITADRGLATAMESAGICVLLVESGGIILSGYSYGFIGGASFLIAPNRLAFTGTLCAHPDEKRVRSFLREQGVEPLFLTDLPAFDIGSGFPVA